MCRFDLRIDCLFNVPAVAFELFGSDRFLGVGKAGELLYCRLLRRGVGRHCAEGDTRQTSKSICEQSIAPTGI